MNVAEGVWQTTTAARFVVRCLGRFRVEDPRGDQLQIRTRKARAVLAALAVASRSASRDTLADLLWSDRGPVQARSSLRQAIFELQHFAGGDVLVVGRDDLTIDRERLVTDIELVRDAAVNGDWARLLALLEGAEPGLLTDLDGLDAEFDDWLRNQRTQEPARTLSAAVGAAERCLLDAGPRAALDLVSEILRLDPANEEATRVALRIDCELGDTRALRDHFNALSTRLQEEYDAKPSVETVELFEALSERRPEPQSKAAPVVPSEQAAASPKRRWAVAFGLLLGLLVVTAGLVTLYWRNVSTATTERGPILLAVLPFAEQPARDRFLADGLRDDTRSALSRNGGLRILGRTTTDAMAARHAGADQFRRHLNVDYLLEGSVQRTADRVRVRVNLTRTADGVAIWQDAFEGRLGDPIALQVAIANGIEGKLRGRLAPGGGRRAEQISTSPEVYSLYSTARQLIYERFPESSRRAQLLLRKAVALDPNYAPAWSALAETTHFVDYGAGAAAERRKAGLAYARRALALAPQLAQAHAIYGFLLGAGSPAAERELRLAVALDPNRAEAWNWLGNTLVAHSRGREATEVYRHAVEIDPIWPPAVTNLADRYMEKGDQQAFQRLVAAVERAGGNEDLVAALRIRNAAERGDLSAAIAPLFRMRRTHGYCDWEGGEALIKLGYAEEGLELLSGPKGFDAVIRSERLPPTSIRGAPIGPRDFWLREDFSPMAARAFVNLGRERELVGKYREAFTSTDDAILEMSDSGLLDLLAPTLAVALQRSGNAEEASVLLDAAARPLAQALAGEDHDRAVAWRLGRIRAAQGRTEEALQLIGRSLATGWLPGGLIDATDISQEPAFHDLRGDSRFESARLRILNHLAKERAELGPLRI